MSKQVVESREELLKGGRLKVKNETIDEAWVSLLRYFRGAGNGAEAKVGCVVITAETRQMQAENNKRFLDLNIEKRLGQENRLLPKGIK